MIAVTLVQAIIIMTLFVGGVSTVVTSQDENKQETMLTNTNK